jgi:hypothetical protein
VVVVVVVVEAVLVVGVRTLHLAVQKAYSFSVNRVWRPSKFSSSPSPLLLLLLLLLLPLSVGVLLYRQHDTNTEM